MRRLPEAWHGVRTVVVGMVHALPLPGSPRYQGDWSAVVEAARRDASALADGGVHGLIVENFGDAPFYRGAVPAETVACLTTLAQAVKQASGLPIGINVLRNDGRSAVAVAKAVDAAFVRINVLSGAVVTDQGVIESDAAGVLRTRRSIDAESVGLWADVRVKHAAPLGAAWRPIEQEVDELIHRAGASALIVSGEGTGRPTDESKLRAVKQAAAEAVPVFVGSGVDAQSVERLAAVADGLIVGSYFKESGVVASPVSVDRVRRFMARLG